jgi:integrase
MSKRKKKEGVKRRGDSQYWWASYTDGSGKRIRRSTGTTSKREAINIRNKWLADEWTSSVKETEPDRTFEQLALLYLDGTATTKRSGDTDKKRFKQWAKYLPEKFLMNGFDGSDVLGYIALRSEAGVSNKTINKELSLMSTMIKWAKQRLEWNLPNPMVGKRLVEEDKEARCLTLDEFSSLVLSAKNAPHSHTRRYLSEFCILGFYTMMRPGELLELEWERVDLGNRVVRLGVENTKGKAKRLVPLNGHAHAALLRLRKVCDEYFQDTPWVFTHTKSRYLGERIKSVRTVFESAVERAGIEWAYTTLPTSYRDHRRCSRT